MLHVIEPDEPQPLRVEVNGPRLTTVGLAGINRPELTIRVESRESVQEAKGLLLRVAAYVVSTSAALEPGDVLTFEGGRVRLEAEGAALRLTDGGPVEEAEPVRRRRRG